MSPVHSLHFLWGRRAGELALFVEECLHTSGGLECRDYSAPFFSQVRECMRNPARRKNRVPACQVEFLPADLEYVVALDHVEPLVLVVMHVERRAALPLPM